ncbi:MAG: 3-deoxy-D-manno-octulosonic acid transferase, partial [Maricaulaceae bacterium]
MTLPLGLRAYRWATEAGAPLVRAWLNRRVRQGREAHDRVGERYGRPGAPRPEGSLVWLHSASVGEGRLSAAMAESLRARIGEVSVLFTCQTRTAADLFAELATADASAQYAPVDTGDAVGAFLDHWRPDLAVWVESELWPNLVVETARRAVPMALINARLSTRAARAWARTPQSARFVLYCFDWIGAIEAETATQLSHLADRPIAAL